MVFDLLCLLSDVKMRFSLLFSGSSKLQHLLNSFGHCVSHSVTLEHDTALAVKQLKETSDIPAGFFEEKFTTLVWDNNDFGEETLTGEIILIYQ